MSHDTAKIFVTGRSQAVRIPKEYRFDCDEVYIARDGDKIILTPKAKSWREYFDAGERFSEDFPEHIEDIQPEERDAFQ